MAKKKKTAKTPRSRFVWLLVLLLSAVVVFWARHELLWAVKGHLLGRIDFHPIENQSDLPPLDETRARPAEVVGIPDYKHSLRFPHEDGILTCYRMVDFGNRLIVCSEKGLKKPDDIRDIIQNRSITGRLESLRKSGLDQPLRRLFQKEGNIKLQADAFLLREDRFPVPPPVRLGILAFCLILCCFSAYKLIQ